VIGAPEGVDTLPAIPMPAQQIAPPIGFDSLDDQDMTSVMHSSTRVSLLTSHFQNWVRGIGSGSSCTSRMATLAPLDDRSLVIARPSPEDLLIRADGDGCVPSCYGECSAFDFHGLLRMLTKSGDIR
jgi:hypothetical protein